MHCLGREYRVVCLQTPECQLVIDIVPAESALHQLILKERQQRNHVTKVLAGSIKLYDMGENNPPEILFLPEESGGLEYIELSAAQENQLRYKITQKFNEMMSENLNSTIVVRPEIHHEYVSQIISDITQQFDLMHDAQNAPKSIVEERNKQQEQQRLRKEKNRAQTNLYLTKRDAKYSQYHLTALQIKQLINLDY